jgi:hypothetical protein
MRPSRSKRSPRPAPEPPPTPEPRRTKRNRVKTKRFVPGEAEEEEGSEPPKVTESNDDKNSDAVVEKKVSILDPVTLSEDNLSKWRNLKERLQLETDDKLFEILIEKFEESNTSIVR